MLIPRKAPSGSIFPMVVPGTRRWFATAAKTKPETWTPPSVAVDRDVAGDPNSIAPSLLPTYYFQTSLPRLSIPKLELTCQRYLDALKPIVTPEQWAETERLCKDFQHGVGTALHKELVQTDKVLKKTSYISAPWFEMYLKDRNPLPINTNPAIVFIEDDNVMITLPKSKWQLVRTTNLIMSSLRCLKALDEEIFEPEVYHLNPSKSDTLKYRKIMKMIPSKFATYGSYLFKAFPLDMSQFSSLFRSTRVPQLEMDKLYKGGKDVRHIVVMRKGHFYTMNCLDQDGNILQTQEIMGALEAILSENIAESATPIGIMTTENRDKWASFRERMISQSSRNLKTFQEIDSALFVLSLDDTDDLGEDPGTIVRHYMHSTGTNRWFDKSFNMITTKDGWAGLNFEHAWGDGVAVMRYINYIVEDSQSRKWANTAHPKTPMLRPIRLQFDVDDACKNMLQLAKVRFDAHVNSLDVNTLLLEKYGKKACKKAGISPDSLMQLGFQVAYHRFANTTSTTYESCSTSAFKHGRTEAIRPATDFTKQLSKAMSEGDWSKKRSSLQELIKKCSEKHGQLTKDAAMGQGFDRHLFAMKNVALTKGESLHGLYSDESYKIINHNILSTSTLASPAVRAGGFGPVVQDGFGIAYQIWDTGLGCIVTSYKGNQDGAKLVDHCQTAFTDIHSILFP